MTKPKNLAICQQIVHALGGSIALKNRVDANGAIVGLDAIVKVPLVSLRTTP